MALGGAGPRTLGLVLAGGRSTRWGSEKAVAIVGGAPMIARVAAALSPACETVAVNAPHISGAADWARAHGLEVLPDPSGTPKGPLAGVLAGLTAAQGAGAAWLLTSPCDTPWIPADLGVRLLAGVGDAPAATVVTAEGSHPLCTLWSVKLLPRLVADLGDGAHPSVRRWLTEVGAASVRFPMLRAFQNLNTPPAPPPSAGRIAAALLVGFSVTLALGVGSTVAFALVADAVFPCRAEPLCGGDSSLRFLVYELIVPLAFAAGGLGAWRIAAGGRRRT